METIIKIHDVMYGTVFNLIYLFLADTKSIVWTHTHSAERRLIKQTIQNVVQDIEAGENTGLQTLFATALYILVYKSILCISRCVF